MEVIVAAQSTSLVIKNSDKNGTHQLEIRKIIKTMCMPVSTMSCCYEAICYWILGKAFPRRRKTLWMTDWNIAWDVQPFPLINRIRKTSTTFKPVEERKWPKILSHIFNHSYTFRHISADDQDKSLHLSEVHTWWKPQCQENVDYSPTFLLWIRRDTTVQNTDWRKQLFILRNKISTSS